MLADDAGTDTLDGEAGTDTLVGGAGNDTYWLGRAKPSSPPRWPASSSNWPSTWSAASSPEKEELWGQVLQSKKHGVRSCIHAIFHSSSFTIQFLD